MHTVVATPMFQRAAKEAGLTEDEIEKVTDIVAADPKTGDVMQGTGGFRKFRFAGKVKGKSGGYRVVSFFSGEGIPAFLIDVFSKGERANLSPAQRNALKKAAKEIVAGYQGRVTGSRSARQ